MLNKVELIGRIGTQPESFKNPNTGKHIVNYSIATTESFKDKKSDQWVESTEWHNLVSFDHTAEYVAKNVSKGELYRIEGRLRTRSWDDEKGNTHYRTEIVVHELLKLPNYYRRSVSDSSSQQSRNVSQHSDFNVDNM